MASSSSAITEVGARLLKGYQWLRRAFQALETAFKKISRLLVQLSGIIICLGAVCAIVGWLLSNLRPDPLGPTWGLGIWLVVLGVFAVALGIMSLTLHYVLRVGMIGLSSVMLLFLGALVVMAGSLAVDLFILPWMAKLFAEFPNLGAVLQSGYNAVQSGVNTASTSVVNAGSSICNA
ncbi:MAG TPA: hypothetical protein VFN35_02005, partial [Ktedonobacteraceae bacterium]|nr:hypothetical protein [Ktedonobacteraceae bacterium]